MLPRANVRKIGIDPKGEVRVDSAGFRAAEFGFQLVPGAWHVQECVNAGSRSWNIGRKNFEAPGVRRKQAGIPVAPGSPECGDVREARIPIRLGRT